MVPANPESQRTHLQRLRAECVSGTYPKVSITLQCCRCIQQAPQSGRLRTKKKEHLSKGWFFCDKSFSNCCQYDFLWAGKEANTSHLQASGTREASSHYIFDVFYCPLPSWPSRLRKEGGEETSADLRSVHGPSSAGKQAAERQRDQSSVV